MTPHATVSLTPILKKLVPLCFVTGAAMEVFMVNTGFCTFCCIIVFYWRRTGVEWIERLITYSLFDCCRRHRDG
ncbi:hypothetical protein P3T76_003149 [Phytophthora citrophthora]|uniref:Uncharacterized protein n=1 Tax=Phytophthora citrophthora TaxID=4793 RepID=A0AAD9LRP2_9STRA|nr:hypothetical protein P3T76_003149 [Phytophthora citrophthora]